MVKFLLLLIACCLLFGAARVRHALGCLLGIIALLIIAAVVFMYVGTAV